MCEGRVAIRCSSEVLERPFRKLPFLRGSDLMTKHANLKFRNDDRGQHFTATSTRAERTMSLLRPSIAGRLLRAGVPSSRRIVPATTRFESTALGTPLTTSDAASGVGITKAGEAKEIQPRHNQPDYTAEVDQASSYVCLSMARGL